MKVIVKFIDPAGIEYYYPKADASLPRWRIRADTPNALMLAHVIDDANDSIHFLDYLARTNGCRMELIPTQSILGTYLSTYTDKEKIVNKLVRIYIVTLPIILFILSLIILKQSVS
jgi:hypothetical protein